MNEPRHVQNETPHSNVTRVNETFHIMLHVTKRDVKFPARDERNMNVTLNFRMERERNVTFTNVMNVT